MRLNMPQTKSMTLCREIGEENHFPVCINSFFLTLRFVYKSIIKFKIIIFWTVNRYLTVYGIFEILDKVSQGCIF